ncbi:MAG: hypothetical protein AAB214_00735 [Fibrobacterota bacterium]
MNLSSLTPWPLGQEQVVTYSTNATGANLETVKEGFRQWSALFTNPVSYTSRGFVRFQFTTNADQASIFVSTNSSANSAGCIASDPNNPSSIRSCNIQLRSTEVAKVRHWIGRIMGVPVITSGKAGIMNTATSPYWIFTTEDLSQIANAYPGKVNSSPLTAPLFEATYKNVSGSEMIIGWANLLARVQSGYLSGYKTIATTIGSGTAGINRNGNPAVYGIFKYSTGGSNGLFYPLWPFMNLDWSSYGGLFGNDVEPKTIGQGCYVSSVLPMSISPTGNLFAFDPSRMEIYRSGNSTAVETSPLFASGITTPIWFYSQSGSVRASTTNPGSSVCSRLSGYGFAVE